MKTTILKITVLIITVSFTASLKGQQSSKLWLWHLDKFSVNPGFIGMNNEGKASVYYGDHFSKIHNAPRNMGVLASGNIKGTNAGIGVNISKEIIGFENIFNGMASYKYGIEVADKHILNMGISLGILHQSFNVNGLYYHDLSESTLTNINNDPERSSFDANIGLTLINPTYYVGLSTNRFIKNKLIYEGQNSKYSFLYKQRINLIGGYTFYDITDDIDIEANAYSEYQKNTPLFYSINARAIYKKNYWLGLGYGANGQIGAQAGLNIKDQVNIGYYFMAGAISQDYNLGTGHEIMLSYRFNAPKEERKPKIVERIINHTVHDTVIVTKTDTVINTVVKTVEVSTPAIKDTVLTKKAVDPIVKKVDEPKIIEEEKDQIIIDDIIELKKEPIDTTKIVFKDVSNLSIKPGHYVVISTFSIQANADDFLKKQLVNGKQCFKFFDSSNKYYYIYIYYSTDYDKASRVKEQNLQYEGIWVKQYK